MSSPQPGRFEGGAIWTEELVLDSRALTDLVSIAFDSGETLVFDGSQGEIDGEVTVTLSGTTYPVTAIEYHSGGQVHDVVEWHRGALESATLHDGSTVFLEVTEDWDPGELEGVTLQVTEDWDNQEV